MEQKYIPKARSFIDIDESSGGEATDGASFHDANIYLKPKEPRKLRAEAEKSDSTVSNNPLALKRINFNRKVSSLDSYGNGGVVRERYGPVAPTPARRRLKRL